MEIVIIGTGNTATVLGRLLKQAGHHIVQVFGRNTHAAGKLATELGTESANYWHFINRDAEIYIVAVSDLAIEEVIKDLQLPEKTVVHTAAGVSKNIFALHYKHYGVFYPLQSLKKEAQHLPETPILIDASDEQTLQQLSLLANSISGNVHTATDEQRLKLHVAAVLCNNFVNHLYMLTEQFCAAEGLDFQLLMPLINETAERLEAHRPFEVQTGPAARKDYPTIEKHLQLLEQHPHIKRIYEMITESIIRDEGANRQ